MKNFKVLPPKPIIPKQYRPKKCTFLSAPLLNSLLEFNLPVIWRNGYQQGFLRVMCTWFQYIYMPAFDPSYARYMSYLFSLTPNTSPHAVLCLKGTPTINAPLKFLLPTYLMQSFTHHYTWNMFATFQMSNPMSPVSSWCHSQGAAGLWIWTCVQMTRLVEWLRTVWLGWVSCIIDWFLHHTN